MAKFIQMYEEKYMRFPEGRSKALTLSYDDGVKADLRLLEIMKKYGLKGTFNLNSKSELFNCGCWHGKMNEEQTYNAFVDCGQEIGLHGNRHIFLDKVPLPEAMNEMVQNRSYLEKKFNRIVRGMAYAYSGYNDDIVQMLRMLGVVYARTTESSHSFDIPKDWLRLKPTCHTREEEFSGLADTFFNNSPEEKPKHRESWLFYLWGHSFEFDDRNNWYLIEDFGARACGRKDIWFATNIEVYEYVQAYNNLVFSMDGERCKNPSAIPVWLEMRGNIYKIGAGEEIVF